MRCGCDRRVAYMSVYVVANKPWNIYKHIKQRNAQNDKHQENVVVGKRWMYGGWRSYVLALTIHNVGQNYVCEKSVLCTNKYDSKRIDRRNYTTVWTLRRANVLMAVGIVIFLKSLRQLQWWVLRLKHFWYRRSATSDISRAFTNFLSLLIGFSELFINLPLLISVYP